jgi:hypothetical protein
VTGLGSLFGAELRRFFSRRVVRGALALGIALTTLVMVIQVARSAESTASQRGTAFVCNVPTNPADGSTVPGGAPTDCSPQTTVATVHHDRRVNISKHYSEAVGGVGVAMVLVAFIVGASFVGAEFGAGSLSTQLIFEPRRTRVITVKAIAVGIGLALAAILLLLYLGVLMYAASELRGVVQGLDSTWFAARAGDIVRVAAAVALGGILAYAITVIARRTVAAVAGLLIGQVASGIVGSLKDWHWVAKYNPATAMILMALNPVHHPGDPEAQILHLRGAIATSCVWAVGLTIIAAVVFSRREVR